MINALIFVKNNRERQLAKAKIFGKTLLEYTLAEINKLDVDRIYLIGGLQADADNILRRRSVDEVIEELYDSDTKNLLLSPFYPFINKEDYERLLNSKEEAALLCKDGELLQCFALPGCHLRDYENLTYEEIEAASLNCHRVNSLDELPEVNRFLRSTINQRLLKNGVNLIDPDNTYIAPEVVIDKDVTIYPNVVIEGKSFIGRGCEITGGSHLVNVSMQDYSRVISSRLVDCNIGKRVCIGPNAHIHQNSTILDKVKIGDNVEIANCSIGRNCNIAHMAYLSNTTLGESVIIGCGVSIVDYDGAHKHSTLIGDYAVIGSNSCLIAPLRVGDYGVVAAGSVIDKDVKDGDMAIARLYQTNKNGYGYKYIKK